MRDKQHQRPLILGLFAASVAPVVLLMASESYWPAPPDFDLTVLEVWYLCSLFGTLLLGMPLAIALKRMSMLTWFHVLLGSVLAGNVFTQLTIYAWIGKLRSDRLLDPQVFMNSSCLGLAAGLGFCVAAWPTRSFMSKRPTESA